MRHILLVICISLPCSLAIAQQSIQYDSDVMEYYEQGIEYYNAQDYKEANRAFRKALSTNKVLPTNLSYYFAETLFHLGQYQNSRNFVEKYLSLTGYSGDFHTEAESLLELLDAKFDEILTCQRCNRFGYRLIPCDRCESSGLEITTCDQCKGLGNSMCPKCTGKGITITVDAFDQRIYEECDKCKGDGHISCEQCEGTKVITRTCVVCLGAKMRASTTICNHQDEQGDLFEKKKLR